MTDEEILNAMIAKSPELAEMVETLRKNPVQNVSVKKKRGRPKKVQQPPINKEDEELGIFRPSKSRQRFITDPETGEKKTLTRSEEVDLDKIKSGKNDFEENEVEKTNYYTERPLEKNLYKTKPVLRNRKNNLVRKKCEECKKEIEVPSICGAASYFRCDDCLFKKGKE